MKPRLRLKGHIWSCAQWQEMEGGWYCLVEIGHGYTPMAAWYDLHSRLFDLEVKQ